MQALIITAEGFEDSELFDPKEALEKAGVTVHVATPEKGHQFHGKHGRRLIADLTLREVNPDDYDLLVIPGGKAPEALRHDEQAIRIVKRFFTAGKPVAAICHGPLLLVDARVVEGRRMTGYPGIQRELADNGAQVQDAPVVVDGNLVTSRVPGDLPEFIRATLALIGRAPS
ncbi:type 1 glutamine amidotransferase domain-containing protein [Thiobacter aerophilum]|uniref:Type 1 glutamine amidotransferase domain-containing protein n=1 Tax=Thiobacter aerophilum TaxID=3121275 RepID=A0ABV0EFE3_9BURK